MDAAGGGGDGQGDDKNHRANEGRQKASRTREEHISGNHEGILAGATGGDAAETHQADKNKGQYFGFHNVLFDERAPWQAAFQVICFHRPNRYLGRVSHKSARIAQMIESFQGQDLDAHYLGYFDCFNCQLFYEAHDVLEDLWLVDRKGVDGDFYKGLIQLAGAFVHLQKNRLQPSAALFKLARLNLEKYPARHHQLDLDAVQVMIADWVNRLEQGRFNVNPLNLKQVPQLVLQK